MGTIYLKGVEFNTPIPIAKLFQTAPNGIGSAYKKYLRCSKAIVQDNSDDSLEMIYFPVFQEANTDPSTRFILSNGFTLRETLYHNLLLAGGSVLTGSTSTKIIASSCLILPNDYVSYIANSRFLFDSVGLDLKINATTVQLETTKNIVATYSGYNHNIFNVTLFICKDFNGKVILEVFINNELVERIYRSRTDTYINSDDYLYINNNYNLSKVGTYDGTPDAYISSTVVTSSYDY